MRGYDLTYTLMCRVEELMPLAKHKLELPNGWERIHQYSYVLQPNTDEHGYAVSYSGFNGCSFVIVK
jgi:hypothetical protein